MPEVNGIDLCRLVLKENKDIKVIAFSSFDDTNYVKQILRKGAMGYLLKNTDKQTLFKAIREAYEGREFIDALIQKTLIQESISGQRRSMFEVCSAERASGR
jgi:DNA-binding NarL/FixJ family response regulator